MELNNESSRIGYKPTTSSKIKYLLWETFVNNDNSESGFFNFLTLTSVLHSRVKKVRHMISYKFFQLANFGNTYSIYRCIINIHGSVSKSINL